MLESAAMTGGSPDPVGVLPLGVGPGEPRPQTVDAPLPGHRRYRFCRRWWRPAPTLARPGHWITDDYRAVVPRPAQPGWLLTWRVWEGDSAGRGPFGVRTGRVVLRGIDVPSAHRCVPKCARVRSLARLLATEVRLTGCFDVQWVDPSSGEHGRSRGAPEPVPRPGVGGFVAAAGPAATGCWMARRPDRVRIRNTSTPSIPLRRPGQRPACRTAPGRPYAPPDRRRATQQGTGMFLRRAGQSDDGLRARSLTASITIVPSRPTGRRSLPLPATKRPGRARLDLDPRPARSRPRGQRQAQTAVGRGADRHQDVMGPLVVRRHDAPLATAQPRANPSTSSSAATVEERDHGQVAQPVVRVTQHGRVQDRRQSRPPVRPTPPSAPPIPGRGPERQRGSADERNGGMGRRRPAVTLGAGTAGRNVRRADQHHPDRRTPHGRVGHRDVEVGECVAAADHRPQVDHAGSRPVPQP